MIVLAEEVFFQTGIQRRADLFLLLFVTFGAATPASKKIISSAIEKPSNVEAAFCAASVLILAASSFLLPVQPR